MKSAVVPNPWRGAVYFILNIILWDVQTKWICVKIMYMTCSVKWMSIQRNAHKDILIFWHLPHYYNTVTLFVRGINYYNSSYSSHNKFSTVITTNHPVITKTTKNECTHSAEPSPQVWWGNRNNNWQENNCRDNIDLTNNLW